MKTKYYKYTGQLFYTYNLYDEHNKTLNFEVLWASPLTDSDLKNKVCTDYSRVLGLSQCIGSMVYTTDIVIMEE